MQSPLLYKGLVMNTSTMRLLVLLSTGLIIFTILMRFSDNVTQNANMKIFIMTVWAIAVLFLVLYNDARCRRGK